MGGAGREPSPLSVVGFGDDRGGNGGAVGKRADLGGDFGDSTVRVGGARGGDCGSAEAGRCI